MKGDTFAPPAENPAQRLERDRRGRDLSVRGEAIQQAAPKRHADRS